MKLTEVLEEKAAVRAIAKRNEKISLNLETARIEKDILFVRKALKGKTGIQQLTKQSDVFMDGVRNIDSGRLPADTAFVVTGILVSHALADAAVTRDEDIAALAFSVKSEETPFYNSELSTKINGEEKTKGILRHMSPETNGDGIAADLAYEVSPFVIAPSQSITPELNILNDVSDGTTDLVVEVAYVGYKITENK